MLHRGTDLLTQATTARTAVPACATYNRGMMQAVVAAAEQTGRPMIMLAGSSHFHNANRATLISIALPAAHDSTATIGVHLDHSRENAASPRSTSPPSCARPTTPRCSRPSVPCRPSSTASLCGAPADDSRRALHPRPVHHRPSDPQPTGLHGPDPRSANRAASSAAPALRRRTSHL
jgi:hypothetical protein